MELIEALRTTGASREFLAEPVPDETVARLLDTARFAPNGGNRQAWKVILVRDPGRKRAIRDLYVDGWRSYVAMRTAGLTPWAPITDRAAEAEVLSRARETPPSGEGRPSFPELLHEVPALLVLLADLRKLAAVDRDLGRYGLIGGASIYPFAWSLLLAARAEGLGGVLTTVATRREEDLRKLLDVPEEFAVAGVIALGRPVRSPKKLNRLPVSRFATIDSFGGDPLGVD